MVLLMVIIIVIVVIIACKLAGVGGHKITIPKPDFGVRVCACTVSLSNSCKAHARVAG